jgi:hypothetical protein
MELFGTVMKPKDTYGKCNLELPEFWCRNSDYVKTHPYLNKPSIMWGDINKNLFGCYKLSIEWMEPGRVFDLRGKNWKKKLSAFIIWYGRGWSSKGGLWKSTSPLEHLIFLGNYSLLAQINYRWAVFNHGPNDVGDFTELWYYLSLDEKPSDTYTVVELNNKEFLA